MTAPLSSLVESGDGDDMLVNTAARLFAAHFGAGVLADAERGVFPVGAWSAIQDAGLHLALLPEEAGGFGVAPREALNLPRVAGEHLVCVPLAETMLAGWLLAGAGIAMPAGTVSIAPVLEDDRLDLKRDGDGWHLRGTVRRIPWGRHADAVAVIADAAGTASVALVPRVGWSVMAGTNLALEPRDTLEIDIHLPAASVAPAAAGTGLRELRAAGAAMRSLQIAGALTRLLAMTVQYVQDRVQFGRPLAKFQVVQHNLAIMAGQVAAASAAADLAAEAFDEGIDLHAIAVAKARTSEAVGQAAAIAHQMHGAMGFTFEHSLHFVTKRLWSWREEFGGETEWQRLLGTWLAADGADALWANLTAI